MLGPPLPDLRVVPTQDIMPHEALDSARAVPLAKRIHEDGHLSNPLLVTAKNGKYILLDGTNRLNALTVLNSLGALVQVVDYASPQVELYTWHHVLTHEPMPQTLERLGQITDLTVSDEQPAGSSVVGRMVLTSGNILTVSVNNADLLARIPALRQFVASNIDSCTVFRTIETSIEELISTFDGFSALVMYSPLSKADVVSMASQGVLAPAGVTRHVVHGRALRLNYPLDALADENIEASHARLQEWLKQRYQSRGIRLYSEAAYLFDE